MKIIEKIKHVIISSGVAILSLPNKIFGVGQDLYGPPVPLYGPPKTTNDIWSVIKIFIIPIAFIIGTIIYLMKSKSKVWKKVIIIISVLIVLILAGILINNLL